MTENENLDKNELRLYLVQNARLCLISPWFPHFFSILGYLNEDRRDFKDIESRIRAIFFLQYLISFEEKEYKEDEMVFNRLLVALPMYIPLPDSLELTDEEKQTAESMLVGVKANWQAMVTSNLGRFGLI